MRLSSLCATVPAAMLERKIGKATVVFVCFVARALICPLSFCFSTIRITAVLLNENPYLFGNPPCAFIAIDNYFNLFYYIKALRPARKDL
jgi:hypothetical protein